MAPENRQDVIAEEMTERVIERLKVIDIEHQNARVGGYFLFRLDVLFESFPIGKAGKRIEMRRNEQSVVLLREFSFSLSLLSDQFAEVHQPFEHVVDLSNAGGRTQLGHFVGGEKLAHLTGQVDERTH